MPPPSGVSDAAVDGGDLDANGTASSGGATFLASPTGVTSLDRDGLHLVAPPGAQIFSTLLVEEQGDKLVWAWIRSSARAELLRYTFSKGGPKSPVSLEGSAISAIPPGCPIQTTLVELGTKVHAVATSECPGMVSNENHVVFSKGAGRALLAFRIHQPKGEPRLEVALDASDHDGDGHDDLSLNLTLASDPSGAVMVPTRSVELAFFDRAAGLARDRDGVVGSFARLYKDVEAKLGRGADIAGAKRSIVGVRTLVRALCADAGADRIFFTWGEGPIPCDAERVLDDLTWAEVRVLQAEGDLVRAAAYAGRLSTPGQARLAKPLRAAFARAAPPVTIPFRKVAGKRPLGGAGPRFGALSFDKAGNLLVRSDEGTLRWDPARDTFEHASEPGWDLSLSDTRRRILGAFVACNGLGGRLSVADPDGEKELLVPAFYGTRCGRGVVPVPLVPLSVGGDGFELLFAGEPVVVEGDRVRAATRVVGAARPGTPRSPSGEWMVVPTDFGLLVLGKTNKLWTPSDFPRAPRALTDCALSDDALRVACVADGDIWFGEERRGDR